MATGQQLLLQTEERLRLALRAGGFGTWVWDRTAGVITWDAAQEALFGFAPGTFDGSYESWLGALHPDDRAEVLRHIEDATRRLGTYEVRHRVVWPDGSVHWIEGLGQVTSDMEGRPTGTTGCTRDVTRQVMLEAQLAAAAEDADRAVSRATLLQSLTASLAGTISVDGVADTLAAHVEGLLGATAVAVALLGRSQTTLGLVAARGFDPAVTRRYAEFQVHDRSPMTDAVRDAVPVVIRTDQLPESYPALVADAAGTGHTLLVAVPLMVPGRMLGSLLLAFSGRAEVAPREMLLVESIAGQCSQALDRARLVERLEEVATTLQEGLMPHDLPVVDGLDVAAVYEPGGDETEQLGGDWYDVFEIGSDAVVLVIGDVMGRGVTAATTMVRLRTAARAYAWVDPNPEVVLRKLDGFVRREAPDDFVTMIYALLERSTGALHLINAGHLPGLIRSLDGTCRLLWSEPGLPLGLAEVDRPTDQLPIEPGESVLLFTDGLVERRDRDIDVCLGELLELVRSLPVEISLPAALIDIVRGMRGDEARGDDVTALLVRRAMGNQSTRGGPGA